ncbi:MAG: DUF1830 domain-containing protein [Acaryochloridaceae cyanobacterium RU_4_10]|nr:DUF1830 domain-containing protein [Acaryochloridaceae cyanobacterium RU_4_10]
MIQCAVGIERVVFPGVCLLFKAPAAAHLEIQTGTVVSAIVSDRIPCASLVVPLEVHAPRLERVVFSPQSYLRSRLRCFHLLCNLSISPNKGCPLQSSRGFSAAVKPRC